MKANMYKVFLVEDEIVVREGMRQNISWEQHGFFYAGDAPDGELALPLIRQIQPDLLITDIKMPFMDGLALIELVRKDLPRTKIVIISGHDDFSYAQQAIRMGVEQYLLKPIIKDKMSELLTLIYDKIETEQQQIEYFSKFQREAQEYEAFSRRRFFEQIVTGGKSVSEISEIAKTLDIDINALSYNIVLFSVLRAGHNRNVPESYTDTLASVQDKIMQFILNHNDFILFRWNVTAYAVLIKGEKKDISPKTSVCVKNIEEQCIGAGSDVDWYIAHGTPVSRLSEVPACFSEASRLFSYRYLCPAEHNLTELNISNFWEKNNLIKGTDTQEIDQECIRNFLNNGEKDEIKNFIDQLLAGAGDKVSSLTMFFRYLAMTVYFAAQKYLESIECKGESYWPVELHPNINVSHEEEVRQYIYKVLEYAIGLRDSESKKQQRDLLIQATKFIDAHYSDEEISLDKVAKKVNISSNYFSAMFSQEIGQTFVEYLTGKRIDEAKRMLRQTKKRSSEIGFAIGYKDPHYFSFVFRKVCGCTPSEYRRSSSQ